MKQAPDDAPDEHRIIGDQEHRQDMGLRVTAFDRQLLGSAGVAVSGRQILKFIPSRLENRLAEIELEYARHSGVDSVKAIAKTVFTYSAPRDRWVVPEQRYHKVAGGSVASDPPKP